MIHRLSQVTGLLTSILIFLGCTHDGSTHGESKVYEAQFPVSMKYAKGIAIDTINGGFQRVKIQNLQTTKTVAEYILIPHGVNFHPNSYQTVIYTPVETFGILSSSYIGFLRELNQIDKITIIENHDYIFNPVLLKQFEQKYTKEIGSNGQINLEKLVLNSPELILTSVFEGGLSSDLQKAQDAGIGVIQCSEWQENHPLARAEWIKLFGALTDQETAAQEIFEEIEANYLSITETCKESKSQLKALFSSMYQGIWYIPGGKSYMAQLIQDANGTYAWQENDETGSLPLSFETIAAKSLNNDIWINPEANSIAELLSRDSRYQPFVKNITHGIFQQNKLTNTNGGNDYWETGVVRPDIVLLDFAKMFHPEMYQSTTFTFFNQLK